MFSQIYAISFLVFRPLFLFLPFPPFQIGPFYEMKFSSNTSFSDIWLQAKFENKFMVHDLVTEHVRYIQLID
jgi:hypothetical protein